MPPVAVDKQKPPANNLGWAMIPITHECVN